VSIAPALATMHATEKVRGNDTVGHIVVVDDDPATRRIVTSYFRDHDMPASSASGRQELIRHLASGAPTLIILDLRLGHDDGLDLLREIRSSSRRVIGWKKSIACSDWNSERTTTSPNRSA
jgi:CheY-like chemotaxis protein